MDGLAYQVAFYTCGHMDRVEAEDDLLNIPRRWSPTSRDLQEIIFCLPRHYHSPRCRTRSESDEGRRLEKLVAYQSFQSSESTFLTLLDPALAFLPGGHRPLPGWAPAKTDAIFPMHPGLRASGFSTPHPTALDLSFAFV
jgi:hypothetical protein